MALTDTCIRFLAWSKSKGVSFEKILTLGRQENAITGAVIDQLAEKYPGFIEKDKINKEEKYADSIFMALGCRQLQSLDKSDFESATLQHDLNLPLNPSLHNQFSVVIDGGTLEHIFNFPQAIRNCMEAIRPHGHFISFSPVNNLMGHGFYQFSPELFCRIFSPENGFRINGIFLVAAPFRFDTDIWYEVIDPALVNERVTLSSRNPVYMMVLAEKIKDTPLFTVTPQQSDYATAWQKGGAGEKEVAGSPGELRSIYRNILPEKKRGWLRKLYRQVFQRSKQPEDLQKINSRFFKKFKAW